MCSVETATESKEKSSTGFVQFQATTSRSSDGSLVIGLGIKPTATGSSTQAKQPSESDGERNDERT